MYGTGTLERPPDAYGATPRLCWQCGAPLPETTDACPACGAAQAAPEPARHTARLAIIGLAVGAVAAALVAGAVLVLRGGEPAPAPTPPVVSPDRTRDEALTAVDEEDAGNVVQAYAAAYSAENLSALSSLFTASFQRKNDGDPVQDRSRALAAYAAQFAQLKNPVYRLSALTITTGSNRGRAAGRYSITSASGTVTGAIQFTLVSEDDELLISRIVTTPETPRPPTPAPSHGRSDSRSGDGTSGSRQYSTTARIKTWWSSGAADAFVHFKAVDESSGQTVAEVLGSDNVAQDELQGPLGETPKRRELVNELRRMMAGKGWNELGRADGGEWYEMRFGK